MKIKTLFITGLLSLTLFNGCSITKDSPLEAIKEVTNTKLDQVITYEEDLSQFKTLELEFGMDVSDIELVATDDNLFTFYQEANREELLAKMDVNKSGDSVKLVFKSRPKLSINTKNSKVKVTIPKSLAINLYSSVNVGDFSSSDPDLTFTRFDATVDVGNIEMTQSDNSTIENIVVNSNVGDIHLTLNGTYDALKQIDCKTNVGETELEATGAFKRHLSIQQNSNVGDVSVRLPKLTEELTADLSTDTGDVTLIIDDSTPYILKVDQNDFTTDLKLKNVDYVIDANKNYLVNNANQTTPNIIRLETNIGDINIKTE